MLPISAECSRLNEAGKGRRNSVGKLTRYSHLLDRVIQTSDTSSHRRDQIANFAEILSNAPAKQRIFEAVYRGKKGTKTVKEIAKVTGFSAKRVTEIAKPLARGEKLFEQGRERINGEVATVYKKLHFVETNKRKILQLARSKKRLKFYHTKTNPSIQSKGKGQRVVVQIPFKTKHQFVRIDEVNEFKKVRNVKQIPQSLKPARLSEQKVKKGFLKLLKERRDPKDWGGESNDIFTTRLTLNGKLRRAAFALKGPAKTGTLVPAKMGKNGDQIQRLFDSPADVFMVQYEGEIAESVISLMEKLALARSLTRREVFFGIIDQEDTYRLRLAYPKAFN